MSGPIDLGKAGNYPIVLSAALKGNRTKDVYTGVRYNHKPDVSEQAETRLRSSASDDATFELSIKDGRDQYKYEGSRQTKDNQYVLIFVPEQQHFVLHQVDSSFDMNLVETPQEKVAAILASEYEQLDGSSSSKAKVNRRKAAPTKPAKKTIDKPRKSEKPKKKPSKREPTPDAEDEDSDDGLTIEYPDGPPPSRFQRSTPLYLDRQREPSVESDADADFEEEEPEEYSRDAEEHNHRSSIRGIGNGDEDEDEDEDELDLEAELEMALEKEMDPTSKGDESSESEEE